MTNERPQPMIFTLEEDNEHAPTYESRPTNLDDSLNQIRQRYRRTEEILAERRSKLVGDTSLNTTPADESIDDVEPNQPSNHHENEIADTDFRLPEIEMPPERDYHLDDEDDFNDDHQPLLMEDTPSKPSSDAPENDTDDTPAEDNPSQPEPQNDDEEDEDSETALSKLFKRYQEERASSPIQPLPEPVLPVVIDRNAVPDPEQGRAAYLNYRQREHNQRVEQSAIAENDIGILIEEDWMAAQQAVKTDGKPTRTLHLQPTDTPEPAYQLSPYAHQEDDLAQRPLITVNVYDLPDLPSTRKIRVLSEQELVAELQRKLRPHLSHAVAGLMHNVLQRKLATLSYDLQMMLNEETPRLVEDVLEYNMETILREIKERL